MPFYSVTEAAAYVRVPTSTMRAWTYGTSYQSGGEKRRFRPVVPVKKSGLLSFWDLVEVHVLASITREHGVKLQKVRKAVGYVQREMDVKRPLLEQEFETDGVSLFVKQLGLLLNASDHGQLAMREMLEAGLRRIERDPSGLPMRLYPWTKVPRDLTEPQVVALDPRMAFGRPTIKGTGTTIAALADRFRAGDSPSDLAKDFKLTTDEVLTAVRWELNVAQAA